MEQASKYTLLSEAETDNPCDTNILSFSFGPLKTWKEKRWNNRPIPCEVCLSVLNSFTKIMTPQEVLAYSPKSTQIKPKLISAFQPEVVQTKHKKKSKKVIPPIDFSDEEEKAQSPGTPKLLNWHHKHIQKQIQSDDLKPSVIAYWLCDFCEHINELEQGWNKPESPDFYFLVNQPHPMINNANAEDISVIFCLDNSGSMSSTLEVSGEIAGQQEPMGLSPGDLEMLRIALNPVEYQAQLDAIRISNTSQRAFHMTRKNCLIRSIQKALNRMKEEHPLRRVGVVIFNDQVQISGDGRYSPTFINGNDLLQVNRCFQAGLNSKNLITQTITESFQTVIKSYKDSREEGRTALGPALAAAVGLASTGKSGSKVILCTDGLANVGVGDLTIADPTELATYEQIAKMADEYDVAVSVMTIVGEQSKLEVLGKVVDKTGGQVERVDPRVINEEIRAMINDNIIARKASITMYLPNFLRFTGEDVETLSEGGSVCRKEIGNISENSRVSLKFAIKSHVFRSKKRSLQEGEKLLFHAQTSFNDLDGSNVIRVASTQFSWTFDADKAFSFANVGIIANHAAGEVGQMMAERLNESDMILRQNLWNIFMEKVREAKREHDRLNAQDDVSMQRFQSDSRRVEELTMKLRRPSKQLVQKNSVEQTGNSDEVTMMAMRMKKRNY